MFIKLSNSFINKQRLVAAVDLRLDFVVLYNYATNDTFFTSTTRFMRMSALSFLPSFFIFSTTSKNELSFIECT